MAVSVTITDKGRDVNPTHIQFCTSIIRIQLYTNGGPEDDLVGSKHVATERDELIRKLTKLRWRCRAKSTLQEPQRL